jgi:hypothetical protein
MEMILKKHSGELPLERFLEKTIRPGSKAHLASLKHDVLKVDWVIVFSYLNHP